MKFPTRFHDNQPIAPEEGAGPLRPSVGRSALVTQFGLTACQPCQGKVAYA